MGSSIPVRTTTQELSSPVDSGSGSSSPQPGIATCVVDESVFEKLPADIIHHIHSLMPLRDAARAACLSRGILDSWRCYSNLTLSTETIGLSRKKPEDADTFLINIVDHILEKHSGNGVDIFRLDLLSCDNVNANGVDIFRLDLLSCDNVNASCLDRWLRIAVCWGAKELSLVMPSQLKKEYVFPCSVFTSEAAASLIRVLDLHGCAFRPTAALGCLRGLIKLRLSFIDITDEGLGNLLSTSIALERMDVIACSKIISLRIPFTLLKLKFLTVALCDRLQSVDIHAPKLSTFQCIGTQLEEISVADPWQLKDVNMSSFGPSCVLSFARAKLPAVAQNVESMKLISLGENVNTPMLISKFPCLKKLEINIRIRFPAFDILSLVSFLGASPALESFIVHVGEGALRHDESIVGGDNAYYLRWRPQCQHDRLREVTITGFYSAKNLIQLVIFILESTPSLVCLTLDTTPGYTRRCGIIGKTERCGWLNENIILEAHRAVEAVNRYITERVPSGVRFQVVEPCSQCHFQRRR